MAIVLIIAIPVAHHPGGRHDLRHRPQPRGLRRRRVASPASSAPRPSASDSSARRGRPTTTARSDARERAEETRKAIGSGGAAPRPRAAPRSWRWPPVDEEELGVSRRQFFNRGSSSRWRSASVRSAPRRSRSSTPSPPAASAARSTPASASPTRSAYWRRQQGAVLRARGPHLPRSRTRRPTCPKAKKVPQYAPVLPGMEQGIVALYQKCVHLGCRVPWCQTSQWFECPCHGSKYNRVGEKKGGPAPRGLDRFVVTVAGDKMTIDTGRRDHRPADRHRHHRPGRRRAALRR